MNATIYLRVSTQRQADSGVSLGSADEAGFQETKCRELCALRGWEVAGVESDPLSGRTMKRPGLARALAACCASKGVLTVYSMSRLARSVRDAYQIANSLKDCGASLASATESQIDTTSAIGQAFFGIVAVMAQLESDQTSERVKAADRHIRAKLGFRTMGRQAFGWRFDAASQGLVEIPEQQAVIRYVLDCYRSFDRDAVQLAEFLNADGVQPPCGGLWTPRKAARFVAKHAKAKRAPPGSGDKSTR